MHNFFLSCKTLYKYFNKSIFSSSNKIENCYPIIDCYPSAYYQYKYIGITLVCNLFVRSTTHQ